MIFASEDVGNSAPQALSVAVSVARAVEQIGMPEAEINLAQGVIYLARAKKSREVINGIKAAREDVRNNGIKPPPGKLVNETSMRKDDASGEGDSCMPVGLEDRDYLENYLGINSDGSRP